MSATGYCFSLADGKNWHLTGEPEVLPWLDRLASIAGIKKGGAGGNSSRIHFRAMRKGGVAGSGIVPVPGSGEPDLTVWSDEGLRIYLDNRTCDASCELGNGGEWEPEIMNMLHSLLPVYWRSLHEGGLPLHAALLERAGVGVLVAASGGTGKSTCCRRLPAPWQALCDDEVLVVPNGSGGFRAHPFPTWSDYLWRRAENRWDIERNVPLKAIFLLSQAGEEEESSVPVGGWEAAAQVSESSSQVCRRYWLRMEKGSRGALTLPVFFNACELVKTIPVYKLKAALDGRFWELIEKTLAELQA